MSAPDARATRGPAPLVIKFGGAALASPLRVRAAVARIHYHRDRERPPVVVVSAPGATTDRILDRVSRVGGAAPPPGLEGAVRRERDRALATGEDRSASVLAAALLGAGIPARSLRGDEAGLWVEEAEAALGGRPVDAEDAEHAKDADPLQVDLAPLRVDPAPLRALLGAGVVPVVSGFQARGAGGELVTLARGGSDLTAVALAEALGSSRCVLVKDVPGIFDRDPRQHPGALLHPTLDWDELVALAEAGGRVVQLEAACRARCAGLPLHVVHYAQRPGSRGGTRVVGAPRVSQGRRLDDASRGDPASRGDTRSRVEPTFRSLRGVS